MGRLLSGGFLSGWPLSWSLIHHGIRTLQGAAKNDPTLKCDYAVMPVHNWLKFYRVMQLRDIHNCAGFLLK